MGLRRSVLRAIENATIAPGVITGLWDGTEVTADVNNSAVTTVRLNSTNITTESALSDDTTHTIESYGFASQDPAAQTLYQYTNDVSTTAKSILQVRPDSLDIDAQLVLVVGRNAGTGNTEFTDLLHILPAQNSITVLNAAAGGSASGRTYTRDAEQLDLAMSADTYNILARGWTTEVNP